MFKDRDIQRKLKNLTKLPTLAEVGRLLESFLQVDIEGSPEIERELVFIASSDPALSFNILRMVNSAYYGLPRKISNIEEAINIIGFSDLSEYILKPMTKTFLAHLPYYDWRSFWFHSLASAITARYIGKEIDFPHIGEIFTASLMHDIGKIVEALMYPSFFKEAIEKSNDNWVPFFEIERSLTGIDHAFLGGFLARMWRFPYEYIKAIESHHDNHIPEEFHGKKARILSVVTMVANDIVKYYGITTPGASYYVLNGELFEFLNLSREFIDKFSFEIRRETMLSLERLSISLHR